MIVGTCSLCNGLVRDCAGTGLRCSSCGAVPNLPVIPMQPAPPCPTVEPYVAPWSDPYTRPLFGSGIFTIPGTVTVTS